MAVEPHNANSGGREVDRVTISEAATLLGVHPNTVRNRVKAGTYNAQKVVTERGPTWMIDRNSLLTNTATNATQQVVSRVEGQDLERVLTELVSAIEGDPERENRLEAVKLRVDTLKTQALITSGLIIAFSAIRSYMMAPASPHLFLASVIVLLVSALLSFSYMHALASRTAINIERPRDRQTIVLEIIFYGASIGSFILAGALFLWFIVQNSP
jgi:hypothetical protein